MSNFIIENSLCEETLTEVFNKEFFKIAKTQQIIAGLWPYDSKFRKTIVKTLLFVNMTIFIVLVISGIKISISDRNLAKFSDNFSLFIFSFGLFIKYFTTASSDQNFSRMYLKISRNWLSIDDLIELNIMERFANRGKVIGIFYSVYLASVIIGFSTIPLIPIILDFVIPLNQSRQKIIMLDIAYPFDAHKNFIYVYFYIEVYIFGCYIVITGIDPMMMAVMHHFMGISSVIKHRLAEATIRRNIKSDNDESYDLLIKAIRLHQILLELVQTIEKTYSIAMIFHVGLTTLFLTTSAVLMSIQMKTLSLLSIFKCLSMVFGVLFHGYYISWCGQQVTDYSESLLVASYDNEWFSVPRRSQTLLKIIMIRCMKPCNLTAGGVTLINFYNLGMITKTAISYVTVISSFRSD